MEKPKNSIWGQVDQAEELADGIWSVCTPSHGGIMLDQVRWSKIPKEYMTTPYSRGGQYEEDVDFTIPLVFLEAEILAGPDTWAKTMIEKGLHKEHFKYVKRYLTEGG